MTTRHSLFLLSSRQSFITEAERAAIGHGSAAAIRIGGKAAFSNGATAGTCIEALRSGAASAILVDLDSDPQEGLSALRHLNHQAPEARILVASSNRDPDLILQVVRAGAADFLSLPLEPTALAESLTRTMRRSGADAATVAHRGRVTAFMSAKGGCGATTVAVNLAVALCGVPSKQDRSVILLDLDFPGGDVSAMLKLAPTYSLADVAANIHRLDMDLLNSMMLRHESGLQCLAAAGEGENPGVISPKQMTTIVSFLREHYDDVVLAGGGLGEAEMAAVNQAHMVHLVTTLDFLALRRAQQMIDRLRAFGVTGDSLRVVMNRLERGRDLSVKDARQALDAPVVWSIPHDAKTAERAVNEGVPFAAKGRSRLQAAFEEYAVLLSRGEEGSPASGGGVGRFFRRLVPGRAEMPT